MVGSIPPPATKQLKETLCHIQVEAHSLTLKSV